MQPGTHLNRCPPLGGCLHARETATAESASNLQAPRPFRRYNTLLQICADNNDYDRGCQVRHRFFVHTLPPVPSEPLPGAVHAGSFALIYALFGRNLPSFFRAGASADCPPRTLPQLIDRMEDEGVEPNNWTSSAVSSRKSLRHYLKRKFANAYEQE